jgi:hypothetical protein
LSIDDDILEAAREQGAAEGKTLGQVVSDLARQALTGYDPASGRIAARSEADVDLERRFGISPRRLPGAILTNEAINRIREEEGI